MSKVEHFLEFWLSGMEEKVKTHYLMVNHNRKEEVIPSFPYQDIENFLEPHRFYNFTSQNNETVFSLYPKSDSIFEVKTIPCFLSTSNIRLNFFHNREYVLKLLSKLDLKEEYISCDLGSVESLGLNFGFIEQKRDLKRIFIATPVYKRLEVLDTFLEYMTDYLIPALKWENVEVCFALAGEEYESETVRRFIKHKSNCVYICLDKNILGEKKNKLLKLAQDSLSDYLLWIDSDDFFHPKTCLSLINLCASNGVWSSIKNFSFYNTQRKEYRLFEGYDPSHTLFDWGMGSGRVFSSKVLGILENPFPLQNKNMDESIKKTLKEFNVNSADRLLLEEQFVPIGLKTKTNIWGARNYATESLENTSSKVDWLPHKIKDKLEETEYEN